MILLIKMFLIQLLINIINFASRFAQLISVSLLIISGKISFFTKGVNRLEDLAKITFERKYALSVNNATGGLYLAYSLFKKNRKTLLINPLVIPSNYSGALKLGYDVRAGKIDEDTLNFNLDTISDLDVDVISVTHYFGYSCDMERLAKICKDKEIILIEDCSHSHGGKFNGKPLGSFGDVAVVSLQGSKFVSGGEGGIVLCNSDLYFKQLCQLAYQDKWLQRYQRQSSIFQNETYDFGLKYRMHPISAALAYVDLRTMGIRNKLVNVLLEALIKKRPDFFIASCKKTQMGGFCNGFVVKSDKSLRYTYKRDYQKYLQRFQIELDDQGQEELKRLNCSLIYTTDEIFKNPVVLMYFLWKTKSTSES